MRCSTWPWCSPPRRWSSRAATCAERSAMNGGGQAPREPPPRAPARPGVLLLGALLLTGALYANALHGPFVWDDHGLIGRSRLARTLDPVAHLGGAFWDQAA